MSERTTVRYVDMTLTADPDAEPYILEAQCTTCGARSEASADRNDAETWCLRHTGRADDQGRHHTGFRVQVTMFWRVRPHEEIP